ncbi:MAG: hypothetical protein ACO3FI_12910 [Cyclobacteriaceae bacterium]
MNLNLSKVLLTFMLFAAITKVTGQNLQWDYRLPFYGFADNREYFNTVHPPQTIFGARFSPEAGYSPDSLHSVRFGMHITKEFGSLENDYLFNPILYYQYKDRKTELLMGMFPRQGLVDQFPLFLLNDTLRYFRPNVEGVFLKRKFKNGFQAAWVDWTSRQTNTERETFLAGMHGRQQQGRLYFENFFTLYHFSSPIIPIPGDNLRDNAALMLRLGVNATGKTGLDSLTFHTSWLTSFDRLRGVYDWRTPSGMQLGFFVAEKNLFLNALWYSGQSQSVAFGDSFYKARTYGRADMGWYLFNKPSVQVKFVFSIHYIEKSLDTQQLLTVQIPTGR